MKLSKITIEREGSPLLHDLLYRLGITPNYAGYYQTIYAIKLCQEQQDRLLLISKWLYPDVAKRYETSVGAVERNIRTVSNVAWKRNREFLEILAKINLDRPPCNAYFLTILLKNITSSDFNKLTQAAVLRLKNTSINKD